MASCIVLYWTGHFTGNDQFCYWKVLWSCYHGFSPGYQNN